MKSKEEIIEVLNGLSLEAQKVLATKHDSKFMGDLVSSHTFEAWRNKILAYLNTLGFVPSEIIDAIKDKNPSYPSSVKGVQEQLSTLSDLINQDLIDISNDEIKNNIDYEVMLENLLYKFHKVARQLRTRHSGRPTLNISDEYEVQDLLHALLLINFDDVRAEEWTPSYAGGSVRMDFLLKDIQTVIEVKKTRKSMSPKILGEELIIDIEKYQTHPDCKRLYCFVYDPEGLLGNPIGIKNDLENSHKDFLKVIIVPN